MTATTRPEHQASERGDGCRRCRASALAEAAHQRLARAGYLALRDVSCEVSGDEAWLRGRLPSHYLKQVAQAVVHGLEGIRFISNQIEVERRSRLDASVPVAAGTDQAPR